MKEKMQNLVKLLNEYEEWKSEKYIHGNYVWGYDEDIGCIFASRFPDNTFISFDESIAIIICKGYNFIKRLVDNHKIDLDACEGEKTYNNLTFSRDSNYSQYERLLMTLSIQDNPIEFLISILK